MSVIETKVRSPLPLSRWGEVEPPSWLRHFIPWSVLDWMFNRWHLCWSGMVMWKLGYEWSWSIDRSCVLQDYCGWYATKATPQEKAEAMRIIGETPLIHFAEPD